MQVRCELKLNRLCIWNLSARPSPTTPDTRFEKPAAPGGVKTSAAALDRIIRPGPAGLEIKCKATETATVEIKMDSSVRWNDEQQQQQLQHSEDQDGLQRSLE
jgi:hypothetical protein